jgi:hypothetical protein
MLPQTTGRLAELTRKCLENPNRGGARYSSFALYIYTQVYSAKLWSRIRMVGKS